MVSMQNAACATIFCKPFDFGIHQLPIPEHVRPPLCCGGHVTAVELAKHRGLVGQLEESHPLQ
jgi:hypothetical protein